MSKIIEELERAQLRDGIPQFKAGDTVRVHFQVIEGERRRVQVVEGVVSKRQGAGRREACTGRRQSFGVGVERTFPVHSPKIEKIEVGAIGDVTRAKLYYLRGRVGKKARIREIRQDRVKGVAAAPVAAEPEEDVEPEEVEEQTAEAEAPETEPAEVGAENEPPFRHKRRLRAALSSSLVRRTGQKLLRYDRKLGARFVAGTDEAGRGSLAGPLG